MPVALDVAALAADDEQHEVVVARVRELARRRGLDVDEAARPELPHFAADLEARRPAVDEVELVLGVVVVLEAVPAGRDDDRVHTEGVDAERVSHLAEPVALAELVERAEAVCHARSISSRTRCVRSLLKHYACGRARSPAGSVL